MTEIQNTINTNKTQITTQGDERQCKTQEIVHTQEIPNKMRLQTQIDHMRRSIYKKAYSSNNTPQKIRQKHGDNINKHDNNITNINMKLVQRKSNSVYQKNNNNSVQKQNNKINNKQQDKKQDGYYHQWYTRNNINSLPDEIAHTYELEGLSNFHDYVIKWNQSSSTWRQGNPQAVGFTQDGRFKNFYKQQISKDQIVLDIKSTLSKQSANFGNAKRSLWDQKLREESQKPGPSNYKQDREFDNLIETRQHSYSQHNTPMKKSVSKQFNQTMEKFNLTQRTNWTSASNAQTITHDFPIYTTRESQRGRSFSKAQVRDAFGGKKRSQSLAQNQFTVPAPNQFDISENIGEKKFKASFAKRYKVVNVLEQHPSPQEYNVRDDSIKNSRHSQVTFGHGKRFMRFKNDLVTPGPGAYNPPASRFDKIVRKPGNGTFSKGK